MPKGSISGAAPVLPTPFTATGEIDEQGFKNIVNFCIAKGVDCLVFPGLASEYDHLSLDERLFLIDLLGGLTNGHVKFIVGASGRTIEETPILVEAGRKAGAAAAMVVTPSRFKDDPVGLVEFYAQLQGQPIMLQNAPSPMGLGLSAGQVLDIVRAAPNIRYVKEENMPCGQRISQILKGAPDNLIGVFGGAGGRYITDELARGAMGTMPAAELTEVHVAMMRAHLAGDAALVRELYDRVLPLLTMQAVFRWRLTKEVFLRRGLIKSAYTRAPGPAFDAQDVKEFDIMLSRLEDLTGKLNH
ncbi:MAG: hypothetical protein RL186_768, partial [Pseudomonadota bacterium]